MHTHITQTLGIDGIHQNPYLHLVLVRAVLQHAVVNLVVDYGISSQHRHCLCDHAGRFQEEHLKEARGASLL